MGVFPSSPAPRHERRKSSPRSWGCFCYTRPTSRPVFGLPHARGGVSPRELGTRKRKMSSPRSWGCFQVYILRVIKKGSSPRSWGCFLVSSPGTLSRLVFPTLVGVFPIFIFFLRAPARLPHARGGVSWAVNPFSFMHGSSPRSWGCFPAGAFFQGAYFVFPTLVGVFLRTVLSASVINRLPHARGGVSGWSRHVTRHGRSSPRSWGCFPGGARKWLC